MATSDRKRPPAHTEPAIRDLEDVRAWLDSTAPEEWPRHARDALIEAEIMGESINAIVRELLQGDCNNRDFALLEAVGACVARLNAAVIPTIEAAPEIANEPARENSNG